MTEPVLPSFDLIVATVDRTAELDRLLDSLEAQTHRAFRVLLVDQNDDDRLGPVLEPHDRLDVLRLRSGRGLSRARNAALARVAADVVGFPDDDCRYASDVLERIGRTLAVCPDLAGLVGRAVDSSGHSSPSWDPAGAVLTTENLWNRAVSYTIFLRRGVVEQVGPFDERLGLGAPTPWRSGEEIDYLVRAVRFGGRVEYDPALTVTHDGRPFEPDALAAIGERDGGSVGFILGKHHYPARTVARMLVRPTGGALLSLVEGDRARARFHAATLRGRIAGYRAGRAG